MTRKPARSDQGVRTKRPAPREPAASGHEAAEWASGSPAAERETGAPEDQHRHRWREDVGASVAVNMRRARLERHLSLDALANRCGISRSMLSQIENQRSVPSITVLYRISEGLGVPLASLVEPQTGRKLVVLKLEDTRTLSSFNGLYQTRTLFPFDDPLHPIEFYEATLLPGCHQISNAHPVGTSEYLVVVSGLLRLKVGERMVELRPRDSVFFQADIQHEYINPGRENAVLAMVVTRPGR